MKFVYPDRFNRQSILLRNALSLGANIAYVLLFFSLYPVVNNALGILSILPAAIAGWLLGWRLGLFFGLFTAMLNTTLYISFGMSANDSLIETIPLFIILLITGGGLGWLSDLLYQTKKQGRRLTREREILAQQREILQTIFDNIPLMITFYDPEGQLQFVSLALERVLGWSAAELNEIDLLAESYPDPAYRQKVIESIIAASGKWQDFKTRTKDGRMLDTAWTNIRLSDGSNIGIGQDITERKQAEEALRQSEARNTAILKAIPDMIFRLSRDGVYLDYKGNADDELYLPPEAFIEKNITEVMPTEFAKQSQQYIDQALETGEMQIYEYQLQVPSGLREYEARVVASGPAEVLVIARNITKRKQMEAERLRFIDQLQIAAKVSERINAILDPDLLLNEIVNLLQNRFALYHVHIYLLAETAQMLVMRAGSGAKGRLLRKQGHQLALDNEPSLVAQAARRREIVMTKDAGADPSYLPNRLLPETQSEVAVPIVIGDRLLGILDVQDNRPDRFSQADLDTFSLLSGQIAVALENARIFAERKQVEIELELRGRAIAASSNGILIVDATQPDQPVIFVNLAFEQITGYRSQEVIGQNCRFLQGEDRQQSALDELRTAIKEGCSCTVILRNYRKDGAMFWNQLTISPIYDAQDKLTHFVGVQVDITERKQAEETIIHARDQALQASHLKTQLLSKVSHELRTPLNAILGFAELLEIDHYGPLTADQKTPLAEIIGGANYLADLVNELLDQAQLDAGKLVLHVKSFNPKELLREVQTKMSVLAETKGLRLTTEIAPGLPATLSGDPERLQQILLNLVGNAIKFTDSGAVQVRLYCSNQACWAMQVSDTGPGIPAEAQAKIFEPFQQVDNSLTRRHQGSGLGLSIVQQLTSLMGGQVKLESEVGGGSTFTVLLPTQPNKGEM